MKSIILIGFMGTGKTTIGKLLAEKLQMPLVDLDSVIVQQQQMEIDEIFARYGETKFRQLEHEVLCQYVQQADLIISPGGGAVLRAENRAVMNAHCYVIGLTARPEVILARVNQDDTVRPVLENRAPGQTKLERIKQVLEEHRPCYAEADYIIDTSDATVDALAEQILLWINQQIMQSAGEQQ